MSPSIDIGIGVPGPPEDVSDLLESMRAAAHLASALSRVAFDYPDQMLARVAVSNGDATFDLDKPGTSVYMSAVECVPPTLSTRIAVGMTVLVKFGKRNRGRPYIVAIGGAIVMSTQTGEWTMSSRGSAACDYMATDKGPIPDVSGILGETTVFSGPYPAANEKGIFGQVWFRRENIDYLVSLVQTDSSEFTLYCYRHDTQAEVWSTAFSVHVEDTYSYASLNTGIWLQYSSELDMLVVAGRYGSDFYLHWGKLFTFRASTGAALGQIEIDEALDHGFTLVGDKLVKTWHLSTYTNGVEDAVPVSGALSPNSGHNRRIVAYQLTQAGTTAELLWSFDPHTLLAVDGEIPDYAMIRSNQRFLGYIHGPNTVAGSSSYFGQLDLYPNVTGGYHDVATTNPGVPGAYNPVTDQIVVPFAGHIGLSDATATDFGHEENMETLPRVPNAATPTVTEDSRIARAWLVGMDVATGTPTTYAFPEISANDTDHYVIDAASFVPDRIDTDWLEAYRLFAFPPGSSDYNTPTWYGDILPDQHFDILAEVAAGNWIAVGNSNHLTAVYSIYNGLAYAKYWPQYKYHPKGAGYHFGTMERIDCGDHYTARQNPEDFPNNLGNGYLRVLNVSETANHVAVGSDGKIYMAWYQPYGIVSPYHPQLMLGNRVDSAGTSIAGSAIKIGFVRDSSSPFNSEWFAVPFRHTAWRSFVGCWSPRMELLWSRETTKWHDDLQFGSSSLDGAVPYAGTILRLIPTSQALFVLRTERLAVAEPTHEGLSYNGHRGNRYCRSLIESWDLQDGDLRWQEVVFDPESAGEDYHVTNALMWGSEADSGGPWVMGAVTHGGPVEGPYSYGNSSRVFTANTSGIVGRISNHSPYQQPTPNAFTNVSWLASTPSIVKAGLVQAPFIDFLNELGGGSNLWYNRTLGG